MNDMNTTISESTAITNDAAETKVEEKKEVKIPSPIILMTKDGGAIVNVAMSEKVYERSYFSAADVASGILDTPYRTKTVTLPVNMNKQEFGTTWKLFGYLRNECGYRKI